MSELTVQIRGQCRHGYSHPHSVTVLDSTDPTEMFRWCTAGDYAVLTREELRIRLFAGLTEQDPRMPLDAGAEKATQLTDGLFELIRSTEGENDGDISRASHR